MKLADFPFWMRAILAAGLLLLFCNLVIFVPWFTTSFSWKIDPGIATLVGAIIGLGIVGWQARIGFANLTKSQANQAKLDREAREHQLQLEEQRADRKREAERKMLLESIRAEIVSLMDQATKAQRWSDALKAMCKVMQRAGAPPATKEITLYSFDAPIFQANIGKIGLLGISLAADMIIVLSRARPATPIKFDRAIGHDMAATVYEGFSRSMGEWHSDLYYVAMRIIAAEAGKPDTGTLTEMKMKEQADKEKTSKQKSPD
jgi:hypothetical protein